MNSDNEQAYINFCRRQREDECLQISVDKIKLSLKFHVMIKFEEKLTKDDLQNLEYFLKHPDHKIAVLDMSLIHFKQSDINKVIKILSHPKVDNCKIDVIRLGHRKFHEK